MRAMERTARCLSSLAVVLVCSVDAGARANDSAFGGHGSDLAPITESRIRMASERIELELVPDRAAGESGGGLAWRVQATYHFVNPTSERVALQMGFPEVRCDPDEGDCVGRGGEFRNMRTTVRGQLVQHRFGEVTRRPEWPDLGRVFLYDVELAPNEEIEIVHRYVHDRTFVGAGIDEELYYLTRTGASWNGPIGDAEFIVHVPYVPRAIAAHRDYPIERRLIREDGVPRGVSLHAHVRELVPTHDFVVVLAGRDGIGPPQFTDIDCPMIEDVADAAPEDVGLELANVSAEALRTCAAALSTQYGADPGPELAGVLERARTSPDTTDMLLDGLAVVAPHPLPDYTPEWLPAPERSYVERLEAEAARRSVDDPAPSEVPVEGTGAGLATGSGLTGSSPGAQPTARTGGCGGCSASTTGSASSAIGALALVLLLVRRARARR